MANINLIPVMTSNTAPSGVAFASSSFGWDYYQPWNAFNQDGDASCWLANAPIPQQIGYQFTETMEVYSYAVMNRGNGNPVGWDFQGSNDGSNWTTLDTVVDAAFPTEMDWMTMERIHVLKTFNLSTSAQYTYFRLNITAVEEGWENQIGLSEFQIIGSDAPAITPRVVNHWWV